MARFAIELRELRRGAGSPGYRELAQRVHYSPTTLSQAAGGEVLPSLAVALAYVRGCGGDVEVWERRWRAAAAALDPDPSPEDVDDIASGGCAPYVGLAAYGPEDADWFHGRERIVDELVTRVGAHRFVTVLGPSGTGKSSVLRAGLLPRLTTSGSTSAVVFTPGAHPLEECAVQFAKLLGCTSGMVVAELAADGDGLHRLVRQALVDRPSEAEMVLVIDQFEEVFTLCRATEERSRFIAALVAASRSAGSRCRVVVSLRADFYPRCLQDADLATVLDDGRVVVGSMTVDELRQVIVQPARRAGCIVEGTLLAALVAHVHGRVGALPLLSHVLLETWRRRSGNTLTLAGFERAGGIDGALAKTAEAVFLCLTDAQQAAARQAFLRLVALGEGIPDTKRRADKEEFDDDDAVVLTAFGDARLLVRSEHGVEITHEALIGAWPRLRSWLADDRAGQRIHRALTEATATWLEHDHDSGALLRGTRLAVVTDWARQHRGETNRAETAFLDASICADEREHAVARRRARVLRDIVVLLSVLVIVTTTAAIHAVRAQQVAARQGNAAIALNAIREAERLADTNPALAAQISLAAYRIHPSQPTASSLIAHAATATAVPLPEVGADISFAPDGRSVAAARSDLDVTVVFRVNDHGITPMHTLSGGRFPPRFSPDGTILLTIDKDAVPRLWDMTSSARPIVPSVVPAKAVAGTFNPDIPLLVTTDATWTRTDPAQGDAEGWRDDETTRIWDITDISRPRQSATLPNTSAAVTEFAGQGRVMTAITREEPTAPPRLTAWDLTDPADPQAIYDIDLPSGRQPEGVTFAHSDRILYVGDSAGFITAWNVATTGRAEKLTEVRGGGNPVGVLISSPDSKILASVDTSGQLTIWDIAASRRPNLSIQATGHESIPVGMTFSDDAKTLLAVLPARIGERPSLVSWRLSTSRSAQVLCERISTHITEIEWNKYLGGAAYRRPCA